MNEDRFGDTNVVQWLIGTLNGALVQAQTANQLVDTRCRELSLAITKVEEAIHWLEAIRPEPQGNE